MHLQPINPSALPLLRQFIASLGEGAASFRYFAKRPVEIVLTHTFAGLLVDNGQPVAYGHLEKEGDILWLGIAVAEGFKGLGIGQYILSLLIEHAKRLQEPVIYLTVDKTNEPAIRLYEKVGFIRQEEGPHFYKYRYTAE